MQRSLLLATLIPLATAACCLADDEHGAVDEALEQVRPIRVASAADGSPLELIETPLLRFGDPARANQQGSLWAWGKQGRPRVVSEIYHNTGEDDTWIHVMSLTGAERVTAETQKGRWQPQSTQVDMAPLADAPPVAAQARRRLLQMKQIARRHQAHQFWDPNNSRYELRLLPSPVHRYDDASAGLVDGAIFAFAHGTNPEILMLIEARSAAEGDTWQMGFASLGSAEMHVTRGKTDVWTLPRAFEISGRPTDPYWLYWRTIESQP